MKRLFCAMLCFLMVAGLNGCGTHENTKEKVEKVEEVKKTAAEPKTIHGIVVDVTSTRLTVQTDSGVTYNFDRSNMELEGGTLLLDEEIEVTYINKKGDKFAQKGSIKQSANESQEVSNHVDSIDDIVAHMSLEEKVGQMFFVRCPDDAMESDVNTYHLGGYILFDKDFRGYERNQVTSHIAAYQKQASIPLLIGVDEEGGTVNRLSRYTAFRAVPFWAPQDLYAQGGFDLIRSDTKEKAALLKSLGINVNLAPVADVSTNPNDFIYKRSFGKDAQQTSEYVSTVVSEMRNDGIGTTLKHFPGYGNNVDTHTGISIDERTYENFVNNDFLPFEAGIQAGADSILVSHNIIKKIDADHPASLSLKIHQILRKDLHFDGVIMTDDLFMDAIKKYINEDAAAVTAVKAGNDVLVCSDYRVQLPAVIKAVKNQEISEQQLDESVKRILTWKAKLGLINIQ